MAALLAEVNIWARGSVADQESTPIFLLWSLLHFTGDHKNFPSRWSLLTPPYSPMYSFFSRKPLWLLWNKDHFSLIGQAQYREMAPLQISNEVLVSCHLWLVSGWSSSAVQSLRRWKQRKEKFYFSRCCIQHFCKLVGGILWRAAVHLTEND